MAAPTPYLAPADADALAASLVPSTVSAYVAAPPASRAAAVQQASDDVDAAMRYQGRRYDPAQAREFPRVAHESSPSVLPYLVTAVGLAGAADQIWDLDPATNLPVVPYRVLCAVVWQADYLLRPDGGRLDAQHEGLASADNGPVKESYTGASPAGRTVLGRRAFHLMAYYQLKSGRLL